jgi:hypothetical protein
MPKTTIVPLPLHVWNGRSDENSARTIRSTDDDQDIRVFFVTVAYASPVTLDVSIEVDSGINVNYDAEVGPLSLNNEKSGVWFPEGELRLSGGDTLKVTAPAGGEGVRSYITIYGEHE